MKRERTGYPVHSAEQSRAMDVAVEHEYGLPVAVLMENAGRAVADAAGRMGGRSIVVAAGPGSNGGDALVAARMLLGRRSRVCAMTTRPWESLTGLAGLAARRFADAGGEIHPPDSALFSSADLIVDGLLGTGLEGPVREPIATLIAGINAARCPTLSVDVPSGVRSDTGDEPEIAVAATRTVTFGAYKPALVHYPAAYRAGTVELADIGFPPSLYPRPRMIVLCSGFAREIMPVFQNDTHKGRRGTLMVAAGSRTMPGAAALVCRAATLAGAGLVSLACPDALTPIYGARLWDQILRPLPDGGTGHLGATALEVAFAARDEAAAVVFGPGISTLSDVAAFAEGFVPGTEVPLLLDADALNLLAERRFDVPPSSVLTPHPGEMARLLRCEVADVQADRRAAALEASDAFGCVVLLKGAHTVVAAPGEVPVVNLISDPVLATAGSGDVLSGVIGALLAQGVPPFDAALVGVRWHGTAGMLAASNRGETMGASDIAEWLPRAREEILNYEANDVVV